MTVVSVQGLRVELEHTGEDIVADIDLEIGPGEVIGLVGESGSGKTTVGVALLGHARAGARIASGTVTIGGRDLLALTLQQQRELRGSTVAYIPQDPSAALNPSLRIGRQVHELFEFHHSDLSGEEQKARVLDVLGEVGLPADPDFLQRYPHQLSGGQQQRVAIAMAFVLRPALIVLDEPTTGLDVSTQAQVLTTVRDLCSVHQVAALYVTHDLAVVSGLAHQIVVMYAGRIVESGPAGRIFQRPRHPYTQQLIAAVPLISERRELVTIPGRPPVLGARPTGCEFHPRCAYADTSCATTVPEPIEVEPGHLVRCLHVRDLAPDEGAGRTPAPRSAVPAESGAFLSVTGVNAFHGSRQILHDVSLGLQPHECLALVGESGSGKTTLARCIVGLHTAYSGRIELAGRPVAAKARERPLEQRRALQFIFQSPYGSLNPRRSIGEILRGPLDVLFRPSRDERAKAIAAALERVALSPATANQYPNQLSGGERQRVAIARALICQPDILVCDEITSALDVSVQAAIIRLLRELQDEGLALLFITHNLALVRSFADRVIVMNEGRLVEEDTVEAVLGHPAAAYTKGLIAATPTLALDAGSGGPAVATATRNGSAAAPAGLAAEPPADTDSIPG